MKESISGPKKGSQEPTAVKDPISGEMVVSNDAIKSVTLDYCVKNLKNKSDDPEVDADIMFKKCLHNIMRMDL